MTTILDYYAMGVWVGLSICAIIGFYRASKCKRAVQAEFNSAQISKAYRNKES